jgi:hypothetical protein
MCSQSGARKSGNGAAIADAPPRLFKDLPRLYRDGSKPDLFSSVGLSVGFTWFPVPYSRHQFYPTHSPTTRFSHTRIHRTEGKTMAIQKMAIQKEGTGNPVQCSWLRFGGN